MMTHNKTKINENALNVLPDKEKQLIESLPFVDIKPSLSQMAKHTGMSVSTAFNVWNNIQKKFDVEIEFIPKERKFFKE